MNQSVNYSGFVDMFLNSNDDYEPYGCSDINESLIKLYKSVQDYKTGFSEPGLYDE